MLFRSVTDLIVRKMIDYYYPEQAQVPSAWSKTVGQASP